MKHNKFNYYKINTIKSKKIVSNIYKFDFFYISV